MATKVKGPREVWLVLGANGRPVDTAASHGDAVAAIAHAVRDWPEEAPHTAVMYRRADLAQPAKKTTAKKKGGKGR